MPANFIVPTSPPEESTDIGTVKSKVPRTLGAALPPLPTCQLCEHASYKLKDFGKRQWSLKDGAQFHLVPAAAFWTHDTFNCILDQFHLLCSQGSILIVLHDWEFLQDHGDELFHIIEGLNCQYDSHVNRGKVWKVQKAAATRAKTKGAN
jgi:hypothetical protein